MFRKQIILMGMVFVMTMMAPLAPADTIRWLGTAPVVTQLDTVTVGGTIEAGDVFTLTATGLDGTTFAVTISAADTSITNTVAAIVAAWNASTNSLVTPITGTDDDPDVLLTADTAGDAFVVVAVTTEAGGGAADDQTFVLVNTTGSEGPKHWDTAANWSTGAVPDGAHDVFVEDFSGDILFGLDQSGITPLTTLNIGKSFTGKIGSNGSAGISADYLEILSAIVNIGQHFGPGNPTGSGRIKLDLGATATTVTVDGTATPSDTNKPAVRLKMASTSSNLYVNKGNVGLAFESGETATVGVVAVGYISNLSGDSDMFLGDGVTFGGSNSLTITGGDTVLRTAVTTVTVNGGTLTKSNSGAITTLNASGGTVTTWGSGTIGTVNASGATINSNATGTIAALTITGGSADFTKSPAPRTVTTLKLDAGGRLKYDPSVITITNKVDSTNAVTLTASK